MLAYEERARQRDDVLEALQRDQQAAVYAADRARRQYDTADPENRLVTAELERRWNLALQHVHEIEVRIHQHSEGLDQAAAGTGKTCTNSPLNWKRSGLIHPPVRDSRSASYARSSRRC